MAQTVPSAVSMRNPRHVVEAWKLTVKPCPPLKLQYATDMIANTHTNQTIAPTHERTLAVGERQVFFQAVAIPVRDTRFKAVFSSHRGGWPRGVQVGKDQQAGRYRPPAAMSPKEYPLNPALLKVWTLRRMVVVRITCGSP
eukprot:5981080-Amphidinium_carterae.1